MDEREKEIAALRAEVERLRRELALKADSKALRRARNQRYRLKRGLPVREGQSSVAPRPPRLYLLRRDNGALFLGQSVNPSARAAHLRARGERVELVGTLPGGPEELAALAGQHAASAIGGGWFRADGALLAAFGASQASEVARLPKTQDVSASYGSATQDGGRLTVAEASQVATPVSPSLSPAPPLSPARSRSPLKPPQNGQPTLPGLDQPEPRRQRRRKAGGTPGDPRHAPLVQSLAATGYTLLREDFRHISELLALADQAAGTAGEKAPAEVLRRWAIGRAWRWGNGHAPCQSLRRLVDCWNECRSTETAPPAQAQRHASGASRAPLTPTPWSEEDLNAHV